MSQGSPVAVLYDAAGNLLVTNDGAAPTGTAGAMVSGYDGTNSRRILVDTSGRPLVKITDGTNVPAVKAASTATAAADPALAVSLSPNSPTPVAPDTVGTLGALGALNNAAQVALAGQQSAAMFLAAGTLIGTIVPELSFDGGTNWVATEFEDPAAKVVSSSAVFAIANTITVRSILCYGGATHARIRVSAYTSGTANCTLRSSNIPNPFQYALVTDASGNSLPINANGTTPANTLGIMMDGFDSSTGFARRLLVDSQGRLITAPAGSNTTNGFAYGTVATSAVTNVVVRATTYTEQASNAQRSVSSSSASDASAGTGARTIRITYYDSTGAGPSTETITLNGTANVNTVSTTICFIEAIEVVTVGSGGSNAGTITLFAATAGGGGAIGTIAVGDNQTLWAHHYVPTGKTCYITAMTGNNNNSSNQTLFSIKAKSLASAVAVDVLISDTLAEGQAVSQTIRQFGTPLSVVGPARIVLWAQPGGTPSITNRGSFDFYDQ